MPEDPQTCYESPAVDATNTTWALNLLRRPVKSFFKPGRSLRLIGEAVTCVAEEELPPGVHTFDLVYKVVPACDDEEQVCYICRDIFGKYELACYIPRHKGCFLHVSCAKNLMASAYTVSGTMSKPNTLTCPICREHLVSYCGECGRYEASSEVVQNFHDHTGYNVCCRCISYNMKAPYDEVLNNVCKFYRATVPCFWCEHGTGRMTEVKLSSVVFADLWPTLKCLKQFQVAISRTTHELTFGGCGHGSATRLMTLYRDFY